MKNYIFGLDISTSIIGLCILDKDLLLEGKNSQEFIIKIDSIDLKKFDKGPIEVDIKYKAGAEKVLKARAKEAKQEKKIARQMKKINEKRANKNK